MTNQLTYLNESVQVHNNYREAIAVLKNKVDDYNKTQSQQNPHLDHLIRELGSKISFLIRQAEEIYENNKRFPNSLPIINQLTDDIKLTLGVLQNPNDVALMKTYIDHANKQVGNGRSDRNNGLLMLGIVAGIIAATITLCVLVSPVCLPVILLAAIPFAFALSSLANTKNTALSGAMHSVAQDVKPEAYAKANSTFSFFYTQQQTNNVFEAVQEFTPPTKS